MIRACIVAAACLLGGCAILPNGQPTPLAVIEVRAGDGYFATDFVAFVARGPSASVEIRSKAPELWQVPSEWALDEQLAAGRTVVGRWYPESELIVLDDGDPLPEWAPVGEVPQ